MIVGLILLEKIFSQFQQNFIGRQTVITTARTVHMVAEGKPQIT